MQKKGPNCLIQAALTRECGQFSKMYNALYECCGASSNARSTATVWTAIIDRTANVEMDGKLIMDGGRNWIKFNDNFWLLRLRMSRPTLKAALDWLVAAKVLETKKEKKGSGYPVRYVALVPGALETIIDEIKGKGGPVEDMEFPLLKPDGELLPVDEARPVREASKEGRKPKNGLDARGSDRCRRDVRPLSKGGADTGADSNVRPLSKGGERSFKRSSNDAYTFCKEVDDEMKGVLQPFERPFTTENSLEEVIEDIENGVRADFSGNFGQPEQSEEALATRAASSAASLRYLNNTSDFSGNSAQQPKPSETKETKESPAPQLPGKGEEAARPSVRVTARAFPKTSQFLETIQGKMLPLSSVNKDPWAALGFDDRGSVAAAAYLDWKYAVRGNDLKEICKIFPGCPIESWDIWDITEDEAGNKLHVEERATDHGSCLAVVQAWLEYAESKGLPDPWEAIAGKDRETEWPRIVTRATKDFPTWEDKKFREYFKSAYQELRRVK